MITKLELAKMVDHTYLDINATKEDIERICKEAVTCGFGHVCVRGEYAPLAHELLQGTTVGIVAVVGFPKKKYANVDEMIEEQSQYTTSTKVEEVKKIINYVNEIDMVIDVQNLTFLKYEPVQEDIKQVVHAAQGKPVKVILETCFFDTAQLMVAIKQAEKAGASFVKTSTGYGPEGATIEVVKYMGKIAAPTTGVKASGGIKSVDDALKMYEASQLIKAHPFRIGASKLVSEYLNNKPSTTESNY